ncbi:uncharacterized protein LOC102802271 [Saccoglossus kowalevskii]|uniref:Low-density lipoprotein receptor-related protein 1-like n=1 Tax=Saccoglossus kowalevskii TaxID=10224 RepID=A0ABM0MBJ5_SACKO|nr:PREDICTED: low-density lipoprotein receptor-related protein 1-like [Saccoglossus kowalevskii]
MIPKIYISLFVAMSVLLSKVYGSCQYYEYQCGDGSCISDYLRCNGSPQCSDNSDETDCGQICYDCNYMYDVDYPDYFGCIAGRYPNNCYQDEICFTKYTQSGNKTSISLGCMNNVDCETEKALNDQSCNEDEPDASETDCTFCCNDDVYCNGR